MHKRRYEILLPAKTNAGIPVGTQWVQDLPDVLAEVVRHFGAVSYNPHSILGIWVHDGRRFDDALFRLVVDVDDTPENQRFFAEYKERLAARFDQIDVYVVSYAVDVL